MSPITFSRRKFPQTLLQLDTSKSKGPDGIPAIFLKTCAAELALILNKLFQLSYTLGKFPTSWKLPHIFPIPEKGDKSNPLNYRSIAITSLIFRLMEAIITKQFLTFLFCRFHHQRNTSWHGSLFPLLTSLVRRISPSGSIHGAP